MLRGFWAIRLLFASSLLLVLSLKGSAQEAPKPTLPATPATRTLAPVQGKPNSTVVAPPVRGSAGVIPSTPAPTAPLPAPRMVEAPTKPTTNATRTLTVTTGNPGSTMVPSLVAAPCGADPVGPKPPTPAQSRQMAALRIDRMSPLAAPRYGKNEPVLPINAEVPAAEAYIQGLRALNRFESAKALALFNHALSIDPTHPATLQLKAVALYDLGRDGEAAAAARQGKNFAREQPGGLEELSRALEPIQGHRRAFLDLAALHNLTAAASGPGPRRPAVIVAPSRPVPSVSPPPVNTDKPKPSSPAKP